MVHRDVKASNAVLASSGSVKLVDFGLAALLAPDTDANAADAATAATTYCGTAHAMAPEMVAKRPHGAAVDWWGLGVLLFEVKVLEMRERVGVTIQLHESMRA